MSCSAADELIFGDMDLRFMQSTFSLSGWYSKSNASHSLLQVVSTVLFLDCCGCCGPTLVLDQTAVEATGGRAWVAHPFKGALLAYPGNLLHGVLPGALA